MCNFISSTNSFQLISFSGLRGQYHRDYSGLHGLAPGVVGHWLRVALRGRSHLPRRPPLAVAVHYHHLYHPIALQWSILSKALLINKQTIISFHVSLNM